MNENTPDPTTPLESSDTVDAREAAEARIVETESALQPPQAAADLSTTPADAPVTHSFGTTPAVPSAPRTRWAGIIWGVLLAALAALALAVTLEPSWREAAYHWWLSLNGVTGTAYTFLALGAVVLVCAVVGLVGRAQRRRLQRRRE